MPDQNITERRSGYFLNAGTNQKHWCYVKLIREIKRGRVSSKYKKRLVNALHNNCRKERLPKRMLESFVRIIC